MRELANQEFINEVTLIGELSNKRDTVTIKGVEYTVMYIEVLRKECDKKDIVRLILKDVTDDVLSLIGNTRVLVKGMVCSYNLSFEGASTFLCVRVNLIEDGSHLEMERPNNVVRFEGQTSKTPKIRKTPKGKILTELIIATKDIDDSTMYIFTITWNKIARACKNLTSDDVASFWGRLESREYTKVYDDGTEEIKTAYEVSANSMKSYKPDTI